MKKIKAIFGRLATSNQVLKIFSLIAAFFLWLIIVYATDDSYSRTITGVPIQWEQPAALTRQELNIISVEPQSATLTVVGKRYIVMDLSPEDFDLTLQLGNIINTGTQRVNILNNTDSGDYLIQSISPGQASVRVDHVDTKILDIEANITGVRLAEGYIKDEEIVTPGTVEVTGPVSELSRVERAVVSADIGRTLSAAESVSGEIVLLDADGNDIRSENLSMSYETADVAISVLKRRKVPVGIEFTNTPPFFPLSKLEYTFSNDTIEIAGPAILVDNYESITLGYVDMKTLGPGARQVFDVALPANFVNVNNILSVSVSFDTDEFETRTFPIPELSLVNVPGGYDVSVGAGGVSPREVTLVGPREVLEGMTSEDLVAQVDFSGREREMSAGQIRMPVTIFAPAKGTVWAYGDYVTIVDIAEE